MGIQSKLYQILTDSLADQLIADYCLDAPLPDARERLLTSNAIVTRYDNGYVPHDCVVVKQDYNGLELGLWALPQSILDRVIY